MKQTLQLGVLSTASMGAAVLFQSYALTQLGPGLETDALFASMTLPHLVLAVVSGSLMHVLVPLLSGEDPSRLRHGVWGFTVLIGALFSVLAVVLYVTAPWWVPLTVPGFSASGIALALDLTRIQVIGMVFTAINGVQCAAYHARQQFLWTEASPMLASVLALLLLVWALPHFGVLAAAWISTLRMVFQTLLLAPGMGRPVWPDLTSPAIVTAWQRIKPLLLGTAYYKTDPLIDRFLLSTAGGGSLSLYYLAQQIYSAMSQVLNKAMAVPLVPVLSRLHKAGDRHGFRRTFYRKLAQMSVLGFFGLLVVGLLGQSLLALWAGYGSVSAPDASNLWWIMVWLGGLFVGGVTGQICSFAFYACGDTVTPTRMSIATYTVYIPCKIISFYLWGVMGLALATSVYYMTNTLLQIYLLEKKWVYESRE